MSLEHVRVINPNYYEHGAEVVLGFDSDDSKVEQFDSLLNKYEGSRVFDNSFVRGRLYA